MSIKPSDSFYYWWRKSAHRVGFFVYAVLLPVGVLLCMPVQQATAGLITVRNIKLSSSTSSAASTTYSVSFVAATTNTVAGIVVDFCSNSPIVGDTTCTAPTSPFTLTASPGIANRSSNISTLTTVTPLNSNRTLVISGTGASVSSGATISFDITTVTNPGSNATFYARIYTYTTSGAATSYTVATPGSYNDAGGVALATVSNLTITSKVQETLTFCAYTSGSNCAGGTGTALALGDPSYGVLSTSSHYTASSYLSLAHNASGTSPAVTVRFKGDTLKSGANSINAIGNTCTADVTTATTSQFGVRISTAGSGWTAAAAYGCSAGQHALNTTNLTGTYGDTLATSTSPQVESQTTLEWTAKASTTTPSGIYTAVFEFIATATY